MRTRGGYGDVRSVWDAFADRFGHALGVPGNHDLFQDESIGVPRLDTLRDDVTLFDAAVVEWGGMRIGSVSGCFGNPKRPLRFDATGQLDRVMSVLTGKPDLLSLYDGLCGRGRN